MRQAQVLEALQRFDGQLQWAVDDANEYAVDEDGESPGWLVCDLGHALTVRFDIGCYGQDCDARDCDELPIVMGAMQAAFEALNTRWSELRKQRLAATILAKQHAAPLEGKTPPPV